MADTIMLPSSQMCWSPQRKAGLLLALDCGLLSEAEIGERFSVSSDELTVRRRHHGIPGLRSTRRQIYRDAAAKAR